MITKAQKSTVWLLGVLLLSADALQATDPSSAAKAAIVLSRFKEDVSWLELYLPRAAHFVYQVGDTSDVGTAYGTTNNTCGESIVYLTFIIDYYEALPEAVLFAHAHRRVSDPHPQAVEQLPVFAKFSSKPATYLPPQAQLLKLETECRGAWHLRDKAAAASRLQWGKHGFANLRHANLTCPEHWRCSWSLRRLRRVRSGWTGAWLYPKDHLNASRVKVRCPPRPCC